MKSLLVLCYILCSSSIVFGMGFKIAYMQEVSESEKNIMVFDTTAQHLKQVNELPIAIYPSVSKSGNMIAYIAGNNLENLNLHIYNFETKTRNKIGTKSNMLLHPNISPDGKLIAYSAFSEDRDRFEIEVYSLKENKVLHRLSHKSKNYFFPRFVSDSSEVIFQASQSRQERNIQIWNIGENKVSDLDLPFNNCMAPQLSVDDLKALFTCKKEEHWSVFLYDFTKKSIQQITSDKTNDYAPSFDFKGNIYFASDRQNNFKLYQKEFSQESKSYLKEKVYLQDNAADLYSPSLSGNTNYKQSQTTKMPEPTRSSFGALSLNNKLYYIGGHMGREHTYPPESFSDAVSIYTPKTNSWSEGKPRPAKAHGYGLAECGGQIYAFGGFAYSAEHYPKWKSLKRVDRYDPVKDKWSYVGDMPRPRSSNAVIKHEGKIYLAGGWDSTPKSHGDIDGKFHSEIDVFNCESESFENYSLQLPAPLRRAFTGVSFSGKLVFIGGISEGGSHFSLLDNVTAFDPKTNESIELAPLPFPTFAPAAGVLGNEIFVFGGIFKFGDWNYKYVNHIYRYSDKKWSHTGRYLTKTKGFSQVIPYQKKLVVSGGHSYENGTDAPVNDLEFFSN